VLPARHRLRTADEFRAVFRGGARSGGRLLVVHAALTDPGCTRTPRVGFVVPKSVGNSVVRHRVVRRLRELSRAHLASVPAGVDLVVRAAPDAATATFDQLGAELDRCLSTALRRGAR